MDKSREKNPSGKTLASAALILGLVGGALVYVGVDYATRPRPRLNVLLIVIDCLRADHVGAYGYPRDTTPNIDALAEEGEIHLNHKAASSATTASMVSLFTSRVQTVQYVPDGRPALPEILKAHGLATVALQTNRWLLSNRGFDRGFDDYVLLFDEDAPLDSFWWEADSETQELFLRACKRDGSSILERAAEFIDPAREPFFMYVHMMDAHAPYAPEPRFDVFSAAPTALGEKLRISADFIDAADSGDLERAMELRDAAIDLYDGAIRQADFYVGRLIEELKQRDLYERTLIVITADHGDGFVEHSRAAHGNSVYEEVLHVPLVVKRPGENARRTVTDVSSGIDVAPTILAGLGFSRRRLLRYQLTGRPLDGRRRDEAPYARAFLATATKKRGFCAYSSVEDPQTGFKLVVESTGRAGGPGNREVMLFNLFKDPAETLNLAPLLPDKVKALWPELIQTGELSYDAREQRLLDSLTDEEKALLRALGYLN
ncbi:MAG: sulfatase [Planctomycetota bacterium]